MIIRFPSNNISFMASIHKVIKIGIKKLAINRLTTGSKSLPVNKYNKKPTAFGHHGWYIPKVEIPMNRNSLFFVLKYLEQINKPNNKLVITAIRLNNPFIYSVGSKIINATDRTELVKIEFSI